MTRDEETQETRQYLLGNLSEEGRRRMEERLMTEDDSYEELLLGEEELIDDYVADELSGDDRLRFEEHFLCTPERRRQLSFALALNRYTSNAAEKSETESGESHAPAPPSETSWAERLRAFWNSQAWAMRAVVAAVAVAVIAGVLWLVLPRTSQPKTFAAITLTATAGDRAEGAQAAKVPFPLKEDALKISLTLPEGEPPGARYRVEMLSESGETRPLEVAGQDARSVSVVIPAAQLARGRYALKLYATAGDGAERRVPGSYLLNVE